MIFIPKGHIRQCVQKVRLQCSIERLLLGALGCMFRFRNEAVGHRVGVAPAIGPERRNGLAVKHMSKDIRGFEAHPGQAIHLKTPGFDIPIKGAPVMAVNRYVNANLLKVILNDPG